MNEEKYYICNDCRYFSATDGIYGPSCFFEVKPEPRTKKTPACHHLYLKKHKTKPA